MLLDLLTISLYILELDLLGKIVVNDANKRVYLDPMRMAIRLV
jgi:hypothetical protein